MQKLVIRRKRKGKRGRRHRSVVFSARLGGGLLLVSTNQKKPGVLFGTNDPAVAHAGVS